MSDHFSFTDAETALEMARLLDQDRLLTHEVSGLLPPNVAPESVQDVLDLGCGPGGWVLQLAKTHPHLQVHGIDHSHLMIAYARAKAEQEGVANAQYHVMDFQTLAYPDACFDLVNARVVQWFVPQPRRLPLVQEWVRVLRPGGVLRLIEGELPLTTSPALERLAGLFLETLHKGGRTFIAGGRQAGSTLIPGSLLRALGYQQIQERGHAITVSQGLPTYEAGKHDGLRWLETSEPFLLQAEVVSQQDFATQELLSIHSLMLVGGRADVLVTGECARISSTCGAVLSFTTCMFWLAPSPFRLPRDYSTGALGKTGGYGYSLPSRIRIEKPLKLCSQE